MKSKTQFKKYLYIEKIDDNSYYVKYKLHNMRRSMFTYKPNECCYYYKDTYIHNPYTVTLKIIIQNNDFNTLFKSEYSRFKIEKRSKNFDILITSEPLSVSKFNKEIIYTIKGDMNPIIYTCQIQGIIPYNTHKKHKKYCHKKYDTFQKTMYNSSQWSVQHPYYGGGFTPR